MPSYKKIFHKVTQNYNRINMKCSIFIQRITDGTDKSLTMIPGQTADSFNSWKR